MVQPDEFAEAIKQLLTLHALAYGPYSMLPKHHYMVHMPRVLRMLGFLPNTLALERKHKMVKKHGAALANHNHTTSTVLREVTSEQLAALDHKDSLDLTPRLRRPSDAPPEIAKIYACFSTKLQMSSHAQCTMHDKCEKGDVVALGRAGEWIAAEILYFIDTGSSAYLCAKKFRCVASENTYSRWSDTGEQVLAPLNCVVHVFVYCRDAEVTVLHPYGI